MGKLEDWNHDQPSGVIRYYGECFVEGCEERSANYRTLFPARKGFLTNGRYSTGEIDIMSCDSHREEARQRVLKASETPQEFMTDEEFVAQWKIR